jgi:hypothetical protein
MVAHTTGEAVEAYPHDTIGVRLYNDAPDLSRWVLAPRRDFFCQT